MYQEKRWLAMVVCFTLLVSGVMIPGTPTFARAKNLARLSSVAVPLPPNLGDFIVNQQAAIELGKALFWDQQLGGDGVQACASCHFQAGADIRDTNCVNPGHDGIFQTCPPGSAVTPAKFPVRTDDIVGSNGVTDGNFLNLSGNPFDIFTSLISALFGTNRQVTGRNAPSAINAIFNFRSFWDGRANNNFNGVDPFGPTNAQNTFVYKVVNGKAIWIKVAIPNASLASQACGPPNSPVEMAYAGRSFPILGRKMLELKPLAEQVVDRTDSVLGPLAGTPTGLNTTYADMIKAAFHSEWWDYNGVVADGFNMMEANFSLYFGLAVMMYEATLVSDQTPLDKYLAGHPTALTAIQKVGLGVYTGKGRCDKCHGGAELTEAAVSQVGGNPTTGFTNTGVRPVAEDGGDILQPGQAKFKTPGLRNVELNGPYFHNGGYATLRQVVDFYDRGGDFPSKFTDSDVRLLRLTVGEKKALVSFMMAMTDERVRYERAPFDHPSMTLANGTNLPAVGAAGGPRPLNTFLNLDPQQP